MFVQVIRGRTSDAEAVRAAADRWLEELAPGAAGWLGSTVGVTDDGQFLAVARFESADAARHNSDRPEQGRWWEATRRFFDGEPTFMDSEEVTVEQVGDPDRAGFVQVMQGQVTDARRVRELMGRVPTETMAAFRPEILGTVLIAHDDGRWTQVAYFTSEAAAREGERKDPPAEWREVMEEMTRLSKGEPEYLDLRRPVLHSPG
jgi:hypothetical protein